MATPDWFDKTLTLPRPRCVVPTWRLRTIEGLLLGFALAIVLMGTVWTGARISGGLWQMAVGAEGVLYGGMLLMTSKTRRLMRHGVVSLARVVRDRPRKSGLAELGRFLVGVDGDSEASLRVEYEYPTGPGSAEHGGTRVRITWSGNILGDTRFPEGLGCGARFVVLFDADEPRRHVCYQTAGLYRIAPCDAGRPAVHSV